MIRVILFLSIFIFFLRAQGSDVAKASDVVSCECEKPACGQCERQSGETFYTTKCGAGNERVKSCKKPTCVAVEDAKTCWAALGKGVPEKEVVSTPVDEFIGRRPASVPADAVEAGEVKEVSGSVHLSHRNGGVEVPRKGSFVYVGDLIESGADGKIKAVLKDTSEITLPENSSVRVEKVDVDIAKARRQVALRLLMGKVRNQVQKEYKNDNYYHVISHSAVAGVRGTIFIMSFEPGPKEWVSEVTTLEGLVHLENSKAPLKKSDDAPKTSIDIPAGTYASIISGAPSAEASESETDDVLSGGIASPLYKIKDRDLQLLRNQLDFLPLQAKKAEPPPERSIASVAGGDSVCQSPAAQYNQCSWTCEGNPKKQKTCRTDLPGVACVRRLCGAAGQWVDPSRLPSSQSAACQPSKVLVQNCGSYW